MRLSNTLKKKKHSRTGNVLTDRVLGFSPGHKKGTVLVNLLRISMASSGYFHSETLK